MSIYSKLVFFISTLFLLAVGNSVLTFIMGLNGEDQLKWVAHTDKVILETENLLSDMKDAETGQRGFLLTEDISYLEPYNSGIVGAKRHFNALKLLTSDNHIQQERLTIIEKNMQLKFDELAETIRLAKKNHNMALNVVKENKGKMYMDNIREHFSAFTKTETALLEERKKNFLESREWINSSIIYGAIFFTLLSFTTLIFLHKNLFLKLRELLLNTKKMQLEEKIDVIDVKSDDEIGKLLSAFYNMYEKVNSRTKESKRLRDNLEAEAWVKDGLNQLNKVVGILTEKDKVITESLSFVCRYLGSSVGAIYFNDTEENRLLLMGTYALSKQDAPSKSYEFGEGIVGEVARSMSAIFIEKSENNHKLIETACTRNNALSTYTYPLIYQENLIAVMELAFAKQLNNIERSFLDNSGLVIAIAISGALKNEKLNLLLKRSNKVNSELEIANTQMEEQQQQLEESNAQMEEQQQQLEESNAQMEEQQQLLEESQAELNDKNNSLGEVSSELENKVKELEDSGRYKSEFLANMSHELRTPLNSIILLSSILSKNKNEKLGDDEIKHVSTIHDSGEELLRLINDVLDITKVESGHMEIHNENFSLSTLSDEIHRLFRDLAITKGLNFSIEGVSNQKYRGDKHKISQIIKNLLSNAFKFTSSGNITLHFEENDYLSFWVKDDGIGISEGKLTTIFKPFHQVDGSISREYGGTGLGLSISRDMAELMGGYISLSSAKGEGSTFVVNLPDVHEIASDGEEDNVSKLSASNTSIDDNKKSILIIEDNEESANYYCDVVSEHNLNCIVASTGQEGLDIIRNNDIQGVLLDLGLPDMSGIDVIKTLKANYDTKYIPVHIVTARDRDDKWFDIGASGYSQKPISELEIEQALETLLTNVREGNSTHVKELDDISLDGFKICIVDDDIKNIYVLDTLLKSYGADIVAAYNGQEALDVLNNDSDIDIVLMDIMMPVMNGYEAIQKIRENKKIKDIPIIATTAKAMKGEKEKCIDVGASDYISKPIDERALIKMVKAWCEK